MGCGLLFLLFVWGRGGGGGVLGLVISLRDTDRREDSCKGLPSLQLAWHLTEGPFRSKLIFHLRFRPQEKRKTMSSSELDVL